MVCSTESGPTPGLPCIFPFKLDGVAYHTCKLDEKDGSRWCSTKIDKKGQHLPGNWGNCRSDCGKHIIHLWQYGLWSFQTGVHTNIERFLPKNQHAQRKLLNFKNWISGGLRSFQKSELQSQLFSSSQ